MTNIDSRGFFVVVVVLITNLKSKDITWLITKVQIVKAMVLLVVMYRCESWTMRKAERQRIDVF